MKKTKKHDGFTIIEVVLVLAIAGLIFLMVFIAWPALQRSQRDTQRRNDMARFLSQLSSYQTNNNGMVPSGENGDKFTDFRDKYLLVGGDKWNDPSTGETYKINQRRCTKTDCTNYSSESNDLQVYYNATCDGENPVYKQGVNNIAITLKLEGSGIYCGHN
ncbi:type II secretion system protein [Candidatus Saccharibacteria bacterium]|nr:type II secretion system protein [Candidatus Saccharibacteria bacterium]